MFPELYTAASGMIAGQRSIDLVANNLANVRTAGYRPDRPLFAAYVESARGPASATSGVPAARGVRIAGAWRPDTPAALRETGGSLDVALSGKGYFRLGTPSGERLTRNGAFTLAPDGRLVTSSGDFVLDDKGQPIKLQGGPVTISPDGTIETGGVDGEPGTVVARLGIADAAGVNLMREGKTRWRPEGPVAALADGEANVAQGFLEESGVSATEELVSLIAAQRLFEMQQKVVDVSANQIARQALSLAGVR